MIAASSTSFCEQVLLSSARAVIMCSDGNGVRTSLPLSHLPSHAHLHCFLFLTEKLQVQLWKKNLQFIFVLLKKSFGDPDLKIYLSFLQI